MRKVYILAIAGLLAASQALATGREIALVGDSLTMHGEWSTLLPYPVVNYGVGGDNSAGVLSRLSNVIDRKPAIAFVLIGTNEDKNDVLYKNLHEINARLESANIKAIFTTIPYVGRGYDNVVARNVERRHFNIRLMASDLTVIDLCKLLNEGGYLPDRMTTDNLHITPEAYVIWANLIKSTLDKLYPNGLL